MAEIPWFAWIAIVGIVMWGLIAMVNTIAQRPSANASSETDRDEIERLKRRVEDLEIQLRRMNP